MHVMRFEEKIVRLSETKGWSQSDLWRAVGGDKPGGVSRNTVSRWWNGDVKPFDKNALSLARALNVPLDYLADEEFDEPPLESSRQDCLPEDEAAVLGVYRSLKRKVHLDKDTAITGLAIAANLPDLTWQDLETDEERGEAQARLDETPSPQKSFIVTPKSKRKGRGKSGA